MSKLSDYPGLVEQIHPDNDIDPSKIKKGSHKKIKWICYNIKCRYGCPHIWETSPSKRIGMKRGCPFCNRGVQRPACIHESLGYKFPNLADEWHPGNIATPYDFTHGSGQKVFWICKKTCEYGCPHEWEALISDRTRGIGCPTCAHKDPKPQCVHESLAYIYPKLVQEWYHDNKNQPTDYYPCSGKKIKWICKQGHTWKTTIEKRTKQNRGCPHCLNKTESIVCDYLSQYYDIMRQAKFRWCKYKNGNYLPFDIQVNDSKIIIEIDGAQHFKQVAKWKDPKKAQKNDIIKMQRANKRGYTVIRILQEDVYYNRIDWKGRLSYAIEEKYDEPTVIFIENTNMYDVYKKKITKWENK